MTLRFRRAAPAPAALTLDEAGAALAGVLRIENAALEAMDLVAAAAMLAEKQRATRDFRTAQAAEAPGPETVELIAELHELAEQNRRLLERGIAVQGRLIGMVARAATDSARAELDAYGAAGAPRGAARMPAIAHASKA